MFKVGDKIKIIEMVDEPDYAGREGTISFFDDAGQIHGTWGGLAVIPGVDKIVCTDLTRIKSEISKRVDKAYDGAFIEFEEGESNYGADRDGNRGINIPDYYFISLNSSELEHPIDFEDEIVEDFEDYVSEADLEILKEYAKCLSTEAYEELLEQFPPDYER